MSFEDCFPIGVRVLLGEHVFAEDEIIAFARRFDPQRFHVDPEAARDSVFGGLCASGWHTTAMWMRKNLEHRRRQEADLGRRGLAAPDYGPSPGLRNLKWTMPTYPGRTVRFYATAGEIRPMPTRPGWSLLKSLAEAETEDGTPIMRFDSAVLVQIPDRPAARLV